MTSLLAQLRDESGPLRELMGVGCSSAQGKPKRRYVTRGDVRRAARDLMRLLGAHRLRPYHCPSCDQWHLTKV